MHLEYTDISCGISRISGMPKDLTQKQYKAFMADPRRDTYEPESVDGEAAIVYTSVKSTHKKLKQLLKRNGWKRASKYKGKGENRSALFMKVF